jgi:hypothetical protein
MFNYYRHEYWMYQDKRRRAVKSEPVWDWDGRDKTSFLPNRLLEEGIL